MTVKQLIEKLQQFDENREVIIRFGLDKDDEVGYVLEIYTAEQIFENEVAIYAEYTATKEDCNFVGQVDLKEAYQKMKEDI